MRPAYTSSIPSRRVFETRPPFGVRELRAAVPVSCFKHSYIASFFYLFTDVLMASLFLYSAILMESLALPTWLRSAGWLLYWALQSVVCTGLWVLAHECGHGAFSRNRRVNDIIGWALHSLFLVPYHSWQITHARHHSNTGSVEHDEVFTPRTRSQLPAMVDESPLYMGVTCMLMLVFGWFPGYLLFNSSGPLKYSGKSKSHFNPWAAFFTTQQRLMVLWSDVGVLGALLLLARLASIYGATTIIKLYAVPYFLVNAHLVVITYLQHTDVYIPHFRASEWDWVRGALCTVDRSFGSFGAPNTHNTAPCASACLRDGARPPISIPALVVQFARELFSYDARLHHITDTHVLHHFFPQVPFYHAREATAAIRSVLGSYYMFDDTPIVRSLWRAWTNCIVIDDDAELAWYSKGKPL